MPATLEPAQVHGPNLDDPTRYEKRLAVPVLDEHRRNVYRDGRLAGVKVVDAALLELIASNTNRRCERGDYSLIFLGHTDEDGAETEQPPIAGFARNFRVGEFRGEPCLLCDWYLRRDRLAQAAEYPRRSAEVYYSTDPGRNYVDAVSLLKRAPERDLGLMQYRSARRTEPGPILPRSTPSRSNTMSTAVPAGLRQVEAEQAWIARRLGQQERQIAELERHRRRAERGEVLERYRKEGYQFDLASEVDHVQDMPPDRFARHLGSIEANYRRTPPPAPAADAGMTMDDVPRLMRYMRQHNLGSDQYEAALVRYRRARGAGELAR
jgi:hypothetical protein